MMDLNRVSQITNGRFLGHSGETVVSGLVNDTRHDCSNKLYVAIKGPNFDGHDYIDQARDNGANGVLVEKELDPINQIPTVEVADSIEAMGKIAAAWRKEFEIPVLGITGSAGKTTLKELAGSILSISKRGIITEGNLNNHIGVPLTLTRLTDKDEFAVVEMGMNHAGEIRYLSKMTSPTVAIINNAAAAHLDDLGSIEAVALAKGEIIEGLAVDGVQIINADDQYCELWRSLVKEKRVVTFGLSSGADIYAQYEASAQGSEIQVQGCYGSFEVSINLPGEHNVRNALAVIAATLEMGCSIEDVQKGFMQHQPISNRGGIHHLGSMLVIDDTYNANPASMLAAFDTLALHAQQAKNKHASVRVSVVLGAMAELGEQSAAMHFKVGEAVNLVADALYCMGDYQQEYINGFGESACGFSDVQSLQDDLFQSLNSAESFHLILVKGSRSAGMEKVVEGLLNVHKENPMRKG